MKVQKIKFNGLNFILTTPNGSNSPIATIDTFQKGECSYAHLFRDTGKIMQFRKQIGVIDDIEFGEFIEIEIDCPKALAGILENIWSLG